MVARESAYHAGRPSICKRTFVYRPACETSVLDTLKRFGFRPTTPEQREAQQLPREDRPVIYAPELQREHGNRVKAIR